MQVTISREQLLFVTRYRPVLIIYGIISTSLVLGGNRIFASHWKFNHLSRILAHRQR